MNNESNGYLFEHQWFNFASENPDLIKPTHGSMIWALIHINNKLGWRDKFAAPASQTMALTGISSYNTYKKIFDNLVSWGFIKVIKESKNQFTACVIALSKFDKAISVDTPLLRQNLTKQSESTIQSTDSIIKPINVETQKKTTYLKKESAVAPPSQLEVVSFFLNDLNLTKIEGERFFNKYEALNWMDGKSKIFNWKSIAKNWCLPPGGSKKEKGSGQKENIASNENNHVKNDPWEQTSHEINDHQQERKINHIKYYREPKLENFDAIYGNTNTILEHVFRFILDQAQDELNKDFFRVNLKKLSKSVYGNEDINRAKSHIRDLISNQLIGSMQGNYLVYVRVN